MILLKMPGQYEWIIIFVILLFAGYGFINFLKFLINKFK